MIFTQQAKDVVDFGCEAVIDLTGWPGQNREEAKQKPPSVEDGTALALGCALVGIFDHHHRPKAARAHRGRAMVLLRLLLSLALLPLFTRIRLDTN